MPYATAAPESATSSELQHLMAAFHAVFADLKDTRLDPAGECRCPICGAGAITYKIDRGLVVQVLCSRRGCVKWAL